MSRARAQGPGRSVRSRGKGVVRHARESRADQTLESALERGGMGAVKVLRKVPLAGAALASGAALGLASLIGVGELVLAGVAGYVAYRVFKDKASVAEGIREGVKLAKGDATPKPGQRAARS